MEGYSHNFSMICIVTLAERVEWDSIFIHEKAIFLFLNAPGSKWSEIEKSEVAELSIRNNGIFIAMGRIT